MTKTAKTLTDKLHDRGQTLMETGAEILSELPGDSHGYLRLKWETPKRALIGIDFWDREVITIERHGDERGWLWKVETTDWNGRTWDADGDCIENSDMGYSTQMAGGYCKTKKMAKQEAERAYVILQNRPWQTVDEDA